MILYPDEVSLTTRNVYTQVSISDTSELDTQPLFRNASSVPISGLVVTFRSAIAEHADSLERLAEVPEIELGESAGSKLAIVVDSATKRRDQEIWNAVQQLPGVIDLAVAMVALDEDAETNQPDAIRNKT